jgi:AcrR family transcriptional regulator
MQKQSGFKSGLGVLDLSLPLDIGARSQRHRIVEAMIQICAEKTFAETTIADIVSAASISRTTFYKHFTDKRTCFDAAVEACIGELQATAEASGTGTDTPAETVRKATVAILELMAAKPALAQVAVGEAMAVNGGIAERYQELVVPALEGCWTAAGEEIKGSSDPRAAFGRVQFLILDQLLAGRVKQLPKLLPEVVYILILPFAGHDEALRQARLLAAGEIPGDARDASAR